MTGTFPTELAGESVFYLSFYLLTLALHLFLAGSAVVGALLAGILGFRKELSPASKEIRGLLVDWLPFVLGLAVTAGVAPLLFVQVLYQESFYSANLLLVVRFFALIPALMIGFYMLYLGKGTYLVVSQRLASAALLVAAALFMFSASTWTENHLLALRPEDWPTIYAEGSSILVSSFGSARLLVFLGLSCLSSALLLSWLAKSRKRVEGIDRRLSLLACVGVALVAGGALLCMSHPAYNSAGGAGPYKIVVAVALLLLLILWLVSWRGAGAAWMRPALSVATLILMLGILVVRECVRLSGVDLDAMSNQHITAFVHAGKWLFALFLILNGCLIAWCVHMVRRSLR